MRYISIDSAQPGMIADQEVDDGIDKGTNADHHIAHMDAHFREICVEEQADGGVDDVVHQ